MNNWILLVILVSFFVSFSEVAKKKALKMNSTYEVLTGYTTISFLIILFFTKDAFSIDKAYLLIILFKSIIVALSWTLAFDALKELQLSIYGMLKISRILFTILLGLLVLGERISIPTVIGMIIVITGLVLVNTTTNVDHDKKSSLKVIVYFLISCFLSSVSAIIDKKILVDISSSQLQFWFYVFLTVYFWILLLVKQKKIDFKKMKVNYWILIIAAFVAASDRFLFVANENPSSKASIIVILKQLSVVISIFLGKFIFKEKDTIKKLLYSFLIILGLIIMFIF